MADLVPELQFRLLLNKTYRKTKSWEETICHPMIMKDLSWFLRSKIGSIWLRSSEGQEYLKWQHQ